MTSHAPIVHKVTTRSWRNALSALCVLWSITLGVTVVFPTLVYACDVCAVYNSIESTRGTTGSTNVGLAHQFTHFESNQRPFGSTSLPGQHLDSNITQLFINHNVAERTNLQLTIPYLFRRFRRVQFGAVEEGTESGLGDLTLLARHQVVREHRDDSALFVELVAGLTVPTGSTDRLQEISAQQQSIGRHAGPGGSLVGSDELALGRGSYSPVVGANALFQYELLYLRSSLQFTATTSGDYGYRYGDELQWTVAPGFYLQQEDESTTTLSLRIAGEHKGRDRFRGVDQLESSETRVFLGPELQVTVGDNWFFNGNFTLPVKRESSADGVAPRYRLQAVLSRKF